MLKREIVSSLKSLQSDHSEVFKNEKKFNALANDISQNNPKYKAIKQYLSIALFELDETKTDIKKGENFKKKQLAKKTASRRCAKEYGG